MKERSEMEFNCDTLAHAAENINRFSFYQEFAMRTHNQSAQIQYKRTNLRWIPDRIGCMFQIGTEKSAKIRWKHQWNIANISRWQNRTNWERKKRANAVCTQLFLGWDSNKMHSLHHHIAYYILNTRWKHHVTLCFIQNSESEIHMLSVTQWTELKINKTVRFAHGTKNRTHTHNRDSIFVAPYPI